MIIQKRYLVTCLIFSLKLLIVLICIHHIGTRSTADNELKDTIFNDIIEENDGGDKKESITNLETRPEKENDMRVSLDTDAEGQTRDPGASENENRHRATPENENRYYGASEDDNKDNEVSEDDDKLSIENSNEYDSQSNDNGDDSFESFDPQKSGFLLHEYYNQLYEKHPDYDASNVKQTLQYVGDILSSENNQNIENPSNEIESDERFVLDPKEKELVLKIIDDSED